MDECGNILGTKKAVYCFLVANLLRKEIQE